MTLTHIFIFAGLGLAGGRFYKTFSRGWLLFVASLLAVFWLQPASLVRTLPFLLPAASLGLAATIWALTLPEDYRGGREDRWAAGLLGGLILVVSAARYVEPVSSLLAVRPPGPEVAVGAVLLISLSAFIAYRLGRGPAGSP